MTLLRRCAARFAAGMVITQIVTFVAITATVGICCRPAATANGALPDCCRGEGHSCPLLKRSAQPAESDCSMQQCSSTAERAAALLFGNAGVLVTTESIDTPRLVTLLSADDAQVLAHIVAIPTPHPRA